MTWSVTISEGFVLAATIAGDRHAAQGRLGLTGNAADTTDALLAELSALDNAARRARIQAISVGIAAPIRAAVATMPPRALTLLAPIAERSLAHEWFTNTPAPRMGYRAEHGLRRVLRTVAERGRWQG